MGQDAYGAQSYRKAAQGYERGATVRCGDEEEARGEAARLARKRGASGAVAFLRPNWSPEYGDADDPITLAAFGDVPPDVRDALPF